MVPDCTYHAPGSLYHGGRHRESKAVTIRGLTETTMEEAVLGVILGGVALLAILKLLAYGLDEQPEDWERSLFV